MRRSLLLCALGAASAATPALAGTCQPIEPRRFEPQVTALAENDMFNGSNDRNYTSGLQLGVSAPLKLSDCVQAQLNNFTRSDPTRAWAAGVQLTNMIFTPADLTLDPPDPNDRPYSGVTALTFEAFGADQLGQGPQRKISFDEIGVSIGAIGPASGSDDLQSWWHRSVLHIGVPSGWDKQQPNALLAQVTYQHTDQRALVLPQRGAKYGFEADWSLSYGAGAGTFLDYAHVGVGARVGFNIGDDFGPPRIAPSMNGAGFWSPDPASPYFGGYVFVGADQRLMLYDHTLDASPSQLQSRNFINDAQWGWVAHIGGVRLAGVYVWRQRQFHGQPQPDSFGAYSATFSLCLRCYLPTGRALF